MRAYLAQALWAWRARSPAASAGEAGAEARLCAAAFAAAANPMILSDRDGRIVQVNPAFTRLTGYAPEEVAGHTPRLLKSGRQPDAFYEELWRTIRSGQPWRGRLVNRKKSGEIYDVEQCISPIVGANGEVTHYLAIHEEIHERLEHERQLLHDAMFDPVTGLPNWNLLRRRILDAVARSRRSGRFVAVISIDFCEPAGPELRREAAQLVRPLLREVDLVASAHDRLVIVLEDLEDPRLAARPVEQLLRELREQHVRAGIAVYPGDEGSPEVLVQHAEAAGRQAQGHGDVRYFHPTM